MRPQPTRQIARYCILHGLLVEVWPYRALRPEFRDLCVLNEVRPGEMRRSVRFKRANDPSKTIPGTNKKRIAPACLRG